MKRYLFILLFMMLQIIGCSLPKKGEASTTKGEAPIAAESMVQTVHIQTTGGLQYQYPFILMYAFDPSDLTLKVGEPVKFVVSNDFIVHSFTIPELGIDFELIPGATVESPVVVPKQAGTFVFYCQPHGHLGMFGTLSIIDVPNALEMAGG